MAPELARAGGGGATASPSAELGVELLEPAADALAQAIEAPVGPAAVPA